MEAGQLRGVCPIKLELNREHKVYRTVYVTSPQKWKHLKKYLKKDTVI